MRFAVRPVLLASSYVLAVAVCSATTLVNNPSDLHPNDFISWSQLGNSGSAIPGVFAATSGGGGTHVVGQFTDNSGGTVAEVCPAPRCNYASSPGFNPGEFLVWSEDVNGTGTAPLNLTFTAPVRGAGFYLQLTAPGSFVAGFVAFSGTNIILTDVDESDNIGDPIFIGALDSAPDISRIFVDILSCIPSSPGGCNTTDFVIGTVDLATAAPEPATLIPVLLALAALILLSRRRFARQWAAYRRLSTSTVLFLVLVLIARKPALAQDPIPFQPGEAQAANDSAIVQQAAAANTQLITPQTPFAGLPVWTYQILSPVNNLTYIGTIVGQNPFNRGARTTVIPTILIPVIVTFQNTTSGFTATFDPTSTPDAGCTAGQTVMSLVENSPLFQFNDWTLNGTYVGNTQYIDAFQRANFWQYVQNTGDSYHTLLSYTEASPLNIVVSYAAPTLDAEVGVGVPGPCTNPPGSGSTNGAGYEGLVNQVTIDNALNGYIVANGITPDHFPVFIIYNVVMPGTSQPVFYTAGYHSSRPSVIVSSASQTYAIADFQTNFWFTKPLLDTSILSHEIAEWMNDPGAYGRFNGAPAWGHIGQQSGCQANLEVGDALTGTNLAPITGANGFTYHLQELVFYSWFFRTPPIGAGGTFSDDGTLAVDAGPICQ